MANAVKKRAYFFKFVSLPMRVAFHSGLNALFGRRVSVEVFVYIVVVLNLIMYTIMNNWHAQLGAMEEKSNGRRGKECIACFKGWTLDGGKVLRRRSNLISTGQLPIAVPRNRHPIGCVCGQGERAWRRAA